MLTLTTLMISVLDRDTNDLHKLDLTEARWHKLAYSQLSLRCPTKCEDTTCFIISLYSLLMKEHEQYSRGPETIYKLSNHRAELSIRLSVPKVLRETDIRLS
jgi:hypothetical protein